MQLQFSVMVFVTLFLIGLPLIAALAFPWGANLGLPGLWYGMPFAYVLLNLVMYIAHKRKDWNKYSEYVVDREAKVRARDEETMRLANARAGNEPEVHHHRKRTESNHL